MNPLPLNSWFSVKSRAALLAGLVLVAVAGAANGGGGGMNVAVAPAVAATPAASDPSMAGEILVRLRRSDALPALLTRHQLILLDRFGTRPIFRLGVVGTRDLGAIIEALRLDAAVLHAEPNSFHRSPEARRNTAWTIGTPSAYLAQWAPAAMHLPRAHELSNGAGVRVAVLDTGIDRSHPAFTGRLLPGFDFVDFDADPSEVGHPGTHVAYGHGTHVAGLVALAAPAAKIMPLRVLDAEGVGNVWVLAEALLYATDPDGNPATDDGAHIVNMSLGSSARTEILDSVGRLASCAIPEVIVVPADDYSDPGYNTDRQRCSLRAGLLMVAAAGNDGSDSVREYPAAEGVYGLLAVTASTATNRLAAFANSGSWVHMAAPGDGITSTLPGGVYGTWSGTSMSAPLVAGVAALLRASEPALTAKGLARRLERRGAPLCGSAMRQVDALAVLRDAETAANACR